ncbi:hypothetical protein [Borreliella garinii]
MPDGGIINKWIEKVLK